MGIKNKNYLKQEPDRKEVKGAEKQTQLKGRLT